MLNANHVIIILVLIHLIERSWLAEEVSSKVIPVIAAVILLPLLHLSIKGSLIFSGFSHPRLISSMVSSEILWMLVIMNLINLERCIVSSSGGFSSSLLFILGSLLKSISSPFSGLLLLSELPVVLSLLSLSIFSGESFHDLLEQVRNILKSLKNLRVSKNTINFLSDDFLAQIGLRVKMFHNLFEEFFVVSKVLLYVRISNQFLQILRAEMNMNFFV